MMMNGASSLSRKQAMSPVNGQQSQSGSSSAAAAGGVGQATESGSNHNNSTGDANMSRHHHHQMHHHMGGSQPGGNIGPPMNGSHPSPGGGHLDSPGGTGGGGEGPGERRQHTIMPPCPLEKPPRDPNALAYYRNSAHSGSLNMDEDEDNLGPLPYKWEKAYTEGGESYFIDHNTGTSHWLDPRLSKYQKKSLVDCQDDELPYGWEKISDPAYGTYYIDHVNRRTQYENPVLEAKRRRLERQSTASGNSTLDRSSRNRNSSVVDGDDGGSSVMGGKANIHFTRNPSELRGERLTTTLLKSSRGLGFTIVGGDDNVDEFLQIKSIVPNGPAWLDGKLLTGDVLVYVNDTCVLGFNHHEMVNVFQSILPGETVNLEVCRGYPLPFDPNDPNTEVVTTIAVDGIGGGPAAKESEKARLMMDLNMDGNYNFLDMSGGGGQEGGTMGKFIPPYKGVYLPNSSSGTGPNGVFFDDNLKTLPPLGMDRVAPFEILAIQIVKGAMGFGFTIADSATGQRVKKILDPKCCKTLQEGDILLAINTTSVTGMTHTEVVQVLKECAVGKDAVLKIQRGGTSSVSGGPFGGGKGLNLNAIGKFNGGGKKMQPKDGNLYRSKTPTADLFSTQQKEVLPIRPKTPLVDTRVRSKTPSNELKMLISMDAINNNNKGSSKSLLANKSQVEIELDVDEEDDDDVGVVNDDELDSVLKELEVMENNSKGGGISSSTSGQQQQNNLDAKSTASYADHDSINNDIMPYSMDPYSKMSINQLTDRLAEATITGPGGSVSTYLTDNPTTMYLNHGGGGGGYPQQKMMMMNGGHSQQQQQFMHLRNGSALDSASVNSLNMGNHPHQQLMNGNRMPGNNSKMYHHMPMMSSSQSDLTYDHHLRQQQGGGLSNGLSDNNSTYSNTIYANTMGMTGVGGGGGGPRMPPNGGAAGGSGGGLYTTPSIPIMPPIPTYHQESCYCFECEDYHRQKQEYNLHMQNQMQLQTLMQNRAPSSMSNPYARKEYLAESNNRQMMWNKQQQQQQMQMMQGGQMESTGSIDGSPGEFALSEVTLDRQALGFGFRIVGGTEEGSQVTVGHIVPGGAADMDPRVATGDEILSIDNTNVIGASHHRVVQLMGEAGARGRVTMVLRRRMMVNGNGGNDMQLGQLVHNFRFPYDVIVSRNENEGFGFVIISSSNQYYGATIGKLIPGSPSDRCNELKVGDRIIAVNRIDIAGMNHGEIVNLIKESGLHVRLTIGQPVPSALVPPPAQQLQQQQQQQSGQALSVHQINMQQQQAMNNKQDMYFDRYPQQL